MGRETSGISPAREPKPDSEPELSQSGGAPESGGAPKSGASIEPSSGPPSGPGPSNGAQPVKRTAIRALGIGVITGAADDDPCAIGVYASAGAKLGFSFLWTAPVTMPMMFAVVYLASKLGQVGGRGLFSLIRINYSRWVLYPALVAVMIGHTIEAAADLGAMAASINLLIPVPTSVIVIVITATVLALQIFGSYTLIRNIFRWLALALLAYVGSAIVAKPDWVAALKGTLIPSIQFNREFFALLVAVIGTTLSTYLYTWQSNEEVEEEITKGRTRVSDRVGASRKEMHASQSDIFWGMLFSNIIMYFIVLSTAATLNKAGLHDIETAAQAAQALQPLAGEAAGVLFAVGIIGVGFLAVPVMTAGAAYDLCQSFGWKGSLHAKPREAKKFYAAIVIFTLVAMCLNFFGFNPMKALVWSGIVQGFSAPPLVLLMILMTNNKRLMGIRVNTRPLNILAWTTFIFITLASVGLVVTSFI